MWHVLALKGRLLRSHNNQHHVLDGLLSYTACQCEKGMVLMSKYCSFAIPGKARVSWKRVVESSGKNYASTASYNWKNQITYSVWWIFDRASWYRIEILQPTWCTNFLFSTIVSYHVPVHVSSVTALILRRTLYTCSIWFFHSLYAAIRGTD
jgi:hypothetical protein